ncbi:sulfite exporter TauE/SafE family protein [Kribbella sp. DT2]|uniref:sulfite exporter TauE/SafE family protein n=1 Tax=Kribbella sp. DT2 TaxID=3393427 RepID=UPI003CEEBE96
MTGTEHLIIIAAGLGAGLLTSTVGVASLVSFPVLVALGIPPVVANASNTVGLIPAGLGGSLGYRRELREQPAVTWLVVATCAIGSIGGAVLLLALPSGVFEAIVPWLILFTCLIVGATPTISKWLRSRRPDEVAPRTKMSPLTTFFAALTGVYGGYFGAGSGVMMMAVLGLGLDLELRIVNALKTLAVLAANVVAGLIFVFVADLDYTAVGLLAIGSVVGGYAGAHIGRVLPPTLLRILIVLAGIIAAVTMLT